MYSHFRCRRLALQAGGIALALALAGCGDSGIPRKPVFPVKGQVLDADGKPAAGAKLIFHPPDMKDPAAVSPVAIVDEDGTFTLTTYNKGDGAPAGNYAVTIQWAPPGANPNAWNTPDRLKGRFALVSKSPFKATVANQPTTLEPFRLD
jgi:hypothetical protein